MMQVFSSGSPDCDETVRNAIESQICGEGDGLAIAVMNDNIGVGKIDTVIFGFDVINMPDANNRDLHHLDLLLSTQPRIYTPYWMLPKTAMIDYISKGTAYPEFSIQQNDYAHKIFTDTCKACPAAPVRGLITVSHESGK